MNELLFVFVNIWILKLWYSQKHTYTCMLSMWSGLYARRHSYTDTHLQYTYIHEVMCAYSLANRMVGNSATSQFRLNFLNYSNKKDIACSIYNCDWKSKCGNKCGLSQSFHFMTLSRKRFDWLTYIYFVYVYSNVKNISKSKSKSTSTFWNFSSI